MYHVYFLKTILPNTPVRGLELKTNRLNIFLKTKTFIFMQSIIVHTIYLNQRSVF